MVIVYVIAAVVVFIVIGIIAVVVAIGISTKANADKERMKREDRLLEDEKKEAQASAEAIQAAEDERSGREPLTDESGNIQAPVDPWMYIKAAQQGHCLEAQAEVGGHIISTECDNNDNQKWSIDPVLKRIRSKTGYCMSSWGDYHSLEDCNISDNNQKFTYNMEGNRIKSLASGECVANRKGYWIWDWQCSKANDHDQYVRFSTSF